MMPRPEIVALLDEGGYREIAYYAKGIHESAAFAAVLSDEYQRDVPIGAIEHSYMRMVPTGERGVMYAHYPTKPGRGAFAATWCEWPPDLYFARAKLEGDDETT
jgi:hypothetical protein